MPLDFDKPRDKSTIGLSRVPVEKLRELRDEYPVDDIIAGLRAMGGYQGKTYMEDPQRRHAIDRYRALEAVSKANERAEELKHGEEPQTYTVDPIYRLLAWEPFSEKEIAEVVRVLVEGNDKYEMVRSNLPSLYVQVDPATRTSQLRMVAGDLRGGTTISDEALLQQNRNRFEYVRFEVERLYREMERRRRGQQFKPISH